MGDSDKIVLCGAVAIEPSAGLSVESLPSLPHSDSTMETDSPSNVSDDKDENSLGNSENSPDRNSENEEQIEDSSGAASSGSSKWTLVDRSNQRKQKQLDKKAVSVASSANDFGGFSLYQQGDSRFNSFGRPRFNSSDRSDESSQDYLGLGARPKYSDMTGGNDCGNGFASNEGNGIGQFTDASSIVIIKPIGNEEAAEEFVFNSPFRKSLLDKSLFKSVGIVKVSPNFAKKLVSVQVEDPTRVHELCRIDRLGDLPVSCYLPFNSRVKSAVITQIHPRVKAEYIAEALKEQDYEVERVVRLTRKENGHRVDAYCVRVDFLLGDEILPETVSIDYSFHKVRPFNHLPLQCGKCQRFGHSTDFCKSRVATCGKCSGKHKTEDCTANQMEKCANCSGPHKSYAKICPKYKERVQIDNFARSNNISYADAAKFARSSNNGLKPTNVASQSDSNSQQTSVEQTPTDKVSQEIQKKGESQENPPPAPTPEKVIVKVDRSTQTEAEISTQTEEVPETPEVTTPAPDTEDVVSGMLASDDFAFFLAKIISITQAKNPKNLSTKLKEAARQFRETLKSKAQAKKGELKRKSPEDPPSSGNEAGASKNIPVRVPLSPVNQSSDPKRKKHFTHHGSAET